MTLREALTRRFARREEPPLEYVMTFMVEQYNHDMLEASRHNRDMISQFLIALDQPETHDELRETLHEALTDLSDHVARLEEHVG